MSLKKRIYIRSVLNAFAEFIHMNMDTCKNGKEERFSAATDVKLMESIIIQRSIIYSFRTSAILIDFFPLVRLVRNRSEKFPVGLVKVLDDTSIWCFTALVHKRTSMYFPSLDWATELGGHF